MLAIHTVRITMQNHMVSSLQRHPFVTHRFYKAKTQWYRSPWWCPRCQPPTSFSLHVVVKTMVKTWSIPCDPIWSMGSKHPPWASNKWLSCSRTISICCSRPSKKGSTWYSTSLAHISVGNWDIPWYTQKNGIPIGKVMIRGKKKKTIIQGFLGAFFSEAEVPVAKGTNICPEIQCLSNLRQCGK